LFQTLYPLSTSQILALTQFLKKKKIPMGGHKKTVLTASNFWLSANESIKNLIIYFIEAHFNHIVLNICMIKPLILVYNDGHATTIKRGKT
jgi:hypothetical protein